MNMGLGKFIGCSMIVVGSSIGAGILALPMQIAGVGFVLSTVAIFGMWFLMLITGLLVVEVNYAFPQGSCSFGSMAGKIFGMPGKVITWISYLLLLGSLVAAYVAGESSLINSILESTFNISLPRWLTALLFTSVLGSAVYLGTKTVDHCNRGLISLKGMLLIATLVLILPRIDINLLLDNQDIGRAKYFLAASPVFLQIFNYHFIIPSLRIYIGDHPKTLKWVIIFGSFVSLIVYLLWVIATLGVVPLHGDNSFSILSHLGYSADTPDFIKLVVTIMHDKWITSSINGFYNISMTTSFLGVSLGLFDFLADGFKRSDDHFGRLQTFCLTFVPPFVFALFFPRGFMLALNFSASFIAILCIILPALMVYRLRKSTELKSPYRTVCNDAILIAIVIIGVVFFISPILTNLHLLPSII